MQPNIINIKDSLNPSAEDKAELINDYFSYDSLEGTKYVLKSTINHFMQFPEEGLNTTTTDGQSLLLLAENINNIDLVIKLLDIPGYNIYFKDKLGDTIVSRWKRREYIFYYYGNYHRATDLLLKKKVSIYDLTSEIYSKIARKCFKGGGPILINGILDTHLLNVQIKHDSELIVTLFVCNITAHMTDTNENMYLNIFNKLLTFVPNDSLTSSFLDMCDKDYTPFIILALDKKKVCINFRSHSKYNALIYAARNNNIVLAEKFLVLGIDPNDKSIYNEYPLTCAIKLNNLPMIKLLKQYKASFAIVDCMNRSPYELALALGKFDLTSYLGIYLTKAPSIPKQNTSPASTLKTTYGSECTICNNAKCEMLFLVPCGHGPIGSHCIDKIVKKKCPYCNTVFQSTLKIYPVI